MKWQVGDVTITQFVEIDALGGKAYIMPQATPEALREIRRLRPQFADERGWIRMMIHSFLVETPGRHIVVTARRSGWRWRRTTHVEPSDGAGALRSKIETPGRLCLG
jgi:hypothetical protein